MTRLRGVEAEPASIAKKSRRECHGTLSKPLICAVNGDLGITAFHGSETGSKSVIDGCVIGEGIFWCNTSSFVVVGHGSFVCPVRIRICDEKFWRIGISGSKPAAKLEGVGRVEKTRDVGYEVKSMIVPCGRRSLTFQVHMMAPCWHESDPNSMLPSHFYHLINKFPVGLIG